ncbi:MAG: hypothetical protein M3329_02045 [Pseudomonadota bacterium]|nr:hypothetical protein [Pseudomonadota bacterium]
MLREAAEPPGVGYHLSLAPETITPSSIETQLEALRIELEESARYHQRRGWFYGRLHSVTILVGITLGWAAFVAGAGNATAILGLVIAVAGALSLVLYFSRRVEDHEKLLLRYDKLASEIQMEEPTPEHLRRCAHQERQIAVGEPPTYWALKAACYNEVLRARGRNKHLYNISLLPRLLMNFVKFDRDPAFRRIIGD